MPYYDEVFKHLTEQAPHTLAALALRTSDVEVGERLSTEQPTVKVHHSDLTFKVRLRNEDAVLHIEAQTDDSSRKPMPLRMLAYAIFSDWNMSFLSILQFCISVRGLVVGIRVSMSTGMQIRGVCGSGIT